MIYQIKLQYGFVVEANDQAAAYSKAAQQLRDNPGMVIASVHQFAGAKRKTSLLMRIIKGG